ncbi:MAG: hypothetical protein SPI12_00950 [Actinomycetaceae bacterium]|nr:hypothetical protein [Actinomycetaceae bacterium]MDY6082416.1 hypothetical protein [Actinomycetaceae bacterium]
MKKFLGVTLVVGLIGAGAYYLWRSSEPEEDPWADSFWEDAKDHAEDVKDAAADAMKDVKDKASEAASAAQEKVSKAASAAQDKAKDLADDVKQAVK